MTSKQRIGNYCHRIAGFLGMGVLAGGAIMPLACASGPADDEVDGLGEVSSALIPQCPQTVTYARDCRTPWGFPVFNNSLACSYAAEPNQNYCWFGIRYAAGPLEGNCVSCQDTLGHPWMTTRGDWHMQDPVPSNLQIAAHPNSYGAYGYYDPLSASGQWTFYTRDWGIFGTYDTGTIYTTETVTTATMSGGLVMSTVLTTSGQGVWWVPASSYNFGTAIHYPPDNTEYRPMYTFQFSNDNNYFTLTPSPANGIRPFMFRRQ